MLPRCHGRSRGGRHLLVAMVTVKGRLDLSWSMWMLLHTCMWETDIVLNLALLYLENRRKAKKSKKPNNPMKISKTIYLYPLVLNTQRDGAHRLVLQKEKYIYECVPFIVFCNGYDLEVCWTLMIMMPTH